MSKHNIDGGKTGKITQERLKEIVRYDPDSGEFFWKIRKSRVTKSAIAGGLTSDGYRAIMIDGIRYREHRLAWLYIYGYFPENQVDHINRVRCDNRVCNLREVSQSCNQRNCKIKQKNTSGVTGVSFDKKDGVWVARITNNNKRVSLGRFLKKKDAVVARHDAEVRFGYLECDSMSTARQFLEARK